MRTLIDEILEMETAPVAHYYDCNCSNCKGKKKRHLFDCICPQCQQQGKKKNSGLLQEGTWLDSLINWAGSFWGGNTEEINYSVKAGEEYGGKWKNIIPPGLPSWVRKSSAKDGALPYVGKESQRHGLGNIFVNAVIQMAKTESNGRFALPANLFNNNPPNLRPSGKSLITAWGVFQFNRDAWTLLIPASERNAYSSFKTKGDSGCGISGGCIYPWDSTANEEISRPIQRYAELFREVTAAGGSEIYAAAGLRLWHVSPVGWYQSWLRIAKSKGFEESWRQLPSEAKSRVKTFLNNAGIAHSLAS